MFGMKRRALPAAYRLYLPKAAGEGPRASAQTSAQRVLQDQERALQDQAAIALWQSRWVCASCLPRGVVLMDAGYGGETDLRTNITNPCGRHPAQTTVGHPALGRNRPRTGRSPATSKDVAARPQAPTDLVSGAGAWPVNLLVQSRVERGCAI
jgi:hypothetical protein